MSKVLKIKYDTFVKRMDFPITYQNFLNFVEENIKKEDDSLDYKFVEEKTSKEIKTEEDYNELKSQACSSFIPKLIISFIPKEEICIQNEIENSNDSIKEPIPETNIDEYNIIEKKSSLNKSENNEIKEINDNNNKENNYDEKNLNIDNIQNNSNSNISNNKENNNNNENNNKEDNYNIFENNNNENNNKEDNFFENNNNNENNNKKDNFLENNNNYENNNNNNEINNKEDNFLENNNNYENNNNNEKNNNNNNNTDINNIINNNQDINSKIHDVITSIVKEKMKKIEEELIDDIYKNVQIKENEDILNKEVNENMELSILNKDSLSLAVHKGIKCNECNCQEIVGPRFKCLKCEDYNLCQKCEEETEHYIDHIFIKIYQNDSDKEVNYDSLDIKYKNEGLNYLVYSNNLKFKRNMTNTTRIKLKNNGYLDWEFGFKFHCLNDYSELIGESVSINSVLSPETDIEVDLIFKLDKNEISLNNTNRSLYVSYWQMFTLNDLPFGEVTKFIIKV